MVTPCCECGVGVQRGRVTFPGLISSETDRLRRSLAELSINSRVRTAVAWLCDHRLDSDQIRQLAAVGAFRGGGGGGEGGSVGGVGEGGGGGGGSWGIWGGLGVRVNRGVGVGLGGRGWA